MERIEKFRGEYRWLSNFYPVDVALDGLVYPSVENAYVAAKSFDYDFRRVMQKVTAGQAKQLGKLVSVRGDWNSVKVGVMRLLLKQKFSYPWFADKLCGTGDAEIVEGNHWHDNFWGACTCLSCVINFKPKNNLGKLLMDIREESRQRTLDFYG